jgi:hypothetical protein
MRLIISFKIRDRIFCSGAAALQRYFKLNKLNNIAVAYFIFRSLGQLRSLRGVAITSRILDAEVYNRNLFN